MHPVRIVPSSIVLVSCLAFACGPLASSQDPGAASRPAAAAETAPASRPAEARARHPRLGVRCNAVALERERVARVDEVVAGSPADRAGIKVGDVIVKVAGEDIRDDKTYRDVMSRRKVGEAVPITVRRGGVEHDMSATLVERMPRAEPDVITVQHCLVKCSNKPSQPQQPKERTVEEARKLAEEILLKVKNGADFAVLVQTHSEDPGSVRNDPPGSYVLANDGKPKPTTTAIDRKDFVTGFTSIAFALDVGDAAIAVYDPDISPFGFHVIKRIK